MNVLSGNEAISKYIPYWDWTENANIPELALHGEWENGPMKFGGRFGVMGSNVSERGLGYEEIFNAKFTKHMQELTETAYCSTCFEEYQFLIQFPHNLVHNGFHGTALNNTNTLSNMEDTRISSYDPIFYLHHNMVDRQYAYYQALQEARNRTVRYPDTLTANPPMPPYSGNSISPEAGPTVPNPYKITKYNSKPNDGLKYKEVFKYNYDSLLFKGLTPGEFDANTKLKFKTSVGVNFRASKPSRFEIYAIKGGVSTKIGTYVILTPTESKLLLEYDVTSSLEEAGFEPNDKSLHFEIESFDMRGNKIEDTYKPTSEYRNAEGDRVLRYHTDHFARYNPDVRIAKLSTKVEFLKSDGSISDEVKVFVDGNTESVTDGHFQLSSTRHVFLYEEKILQVGLHMGCQVQVCK